MTFVGICDSTTLLHGMLTLTFRWSWDERNEDFKWNRNVDYSNILIKVMPHCGLDCLICCRCTLLFNEHSPIYEFTKELNIIPIHVCYMITGNQGSTMSNWRTWCCMDYHICFQGKWNERKLEWIQNSDLSDHCWMSMKYYKYRELSF